MKSVTFYITLLYFVVLGFSFASCNNQDFSKEEKYIAKEIQHTDSLTNLFVVKTEKIKAYDPLLDDDENRKYLFGITTLQKYYDAYKAYEKGEITHEDVFKTLKQVFNYEYTNSEATVVLLKCKNSDDYIFEILFSHDGVYYSSLYKVGTTMADFVFEKKKQEAFEKFQRALGE